LLDSSTALYFWGFLLIYGGAMYVVSPRAISLDAFFRGTDARGRPVREWWLTASIFISWIFAKSVTNAANLGNSFGIVGGLAYAAYWLSIPLAGLVIYWIRTRENADGLVPFLVRKHGHLAALTFSLAVLIRLYNEIWSNTAVVGGYFGSPGDMSYYLGAILFTAVTVAYSAKGGLRSSIITDGLQTFIFLFFLATVLFTIIPAKGVAVLVRSGSFELGTGVDLLLVALLQVFSYPFHDPVLTDRGFLNEKKSMLRSFVVAGSLGFVCILAFSLVGVYARLENIDIAGNAPAAVGRSLGLATFFFMSVIMITSAGSTLDSTFASFSKNLTLDLPIASGTRLGKPTVHMGIVMMIGLAILGNLPMLAGTDILEATTISGTMVMGLAPIFLLSRLVRYSPWSFHLAFWPGIVLGTALAAGLLPASWAIGGGKYGLLLGTNFYGLVICTVGYVTPLLLPRFFRSALPQES
jgi:SSS family solute:Na+ symporter